MNICPCLQRCLNRWINKNKDKVSTPRESQQEALFAHTPEDTPLSDLLKIKPVRSQSKEDPRQSAIPSYFQQEDKSISLEDDLLDIKLELETRNLDNNERQGEPSRDIQDLIKEELAITPLEVMKTVEIQPEFKEEVLQDIHEEINPYTFNINLDPLDPYYALIHERTNRLGDYFERKGTRIDLPAPNSTQLEIFSIDSQNVSTFIIKYLLKTEYSFYSSTMKNDRLQYSFTNAIAELKVVEALKPNLTRNSISFRRIGSFEVRGCHYVKYQNSSKRQHWEIYLNDDKQQPTADVRKCELFCIKNIRERSQKELQIMEYFEINLNSINAGVMMAKLANQYKTYLNNLQNYLQTNYEQELV